MRLLLTLLLVGCGSSWQGVDNDGDGYTITQGDCYDNPSVDLDGHPADQIYPGAKDTWYDGVDSDCDEADDYDQDGDGHRAAGMVPTDGSAEGDDCWDGPASPPPIEYTALSGFYQPLPEEVHPGSEEVWYDGVDGDCDAASDFDQDGDGHDSEYHRHADGTAGDDCFDAAADTFDNPAGSAPANVNPDAVETWYDGTDADCNEADDYDQDGDDHPVDNDGAGPNTSHDCDDLDPLVYESDTTEIWYNGLDENCDGADDYDQDRDGHDAEGYEADGIDGDDCNDDPATPATALHGSTVPSRDIYAGAADVPYDDVDENCAGDNDFDADGDGQTADDVSDGTGHFGTDCNDRVGTVYSGAPETWYDGIDENCSGGSDYDQDSDGYDSTGYPAGTNDDCDDGNAAVNPGETEDCSTGADDDCSGSLNDEDAIGSVKFFYDGDGDGYGDINDSAYFCEESGYYTVSGTTSSNDDCNDASDTVNPGITIEDCDTTDDDDCDGTTNEQNGDNCDAYYADVDTDGYGAGTSQCWCSAHLTYSSTLSTDCNDAVGTVHPGATETCDLVDQDCDGSTDEGTTHYYTDTDLDGYGLTSTETCTSGSGRVTVDADCDDGDDTVYPAAPEMCDQQQNDCSTAWVASDEDDTVSYVTTADVWSDITSAWAAGTAAAPVTIATAATGTYYVCPGTWYVGLSATAGDDVDVIGPYGATTTALSRNDVSGSVLYVSDSIVYVEGLTLKAGKGTIGGGFTYGGGVFANGASAGVTTVTMVDSEVTDNAATFGGGINAFGFADFDLTNTDVDNNTSTSFGGGLYLQKGAFTCTGGGVYSNTGTTEGGGAFMTSTSTGTLTVTASDWTVNSPDDVAGAHGSFTTKADAAYGASATFSCVGNSGCI